jgi:hypothetical protein
VRSSDAVRDRHGKAIPLRLLVRPGEKHELAGNVAIPVRLDRSDLYRLMLEGVEAMLITDEKLQRRGEVGESDRHADHGAAVLHAFAGEEMPRSHTASTTNDVVRYAAAVYHWARR